MESGLDVASEKREDAARDRAERISRLRGAAKRIDSQPSLLAAANWLRARLPGDERFGDPLSTAGTAPVEVVARGVSSLRPEERDSVFQELSMAGLQLWQSVSEAAGRGRGEVPLALLFTDLVGFSKWALKAGDAVTLDLLREVGAAQEAAVLARNGRITKRLGDGLMATFVGVEAAVEAALDAHGAIAEIQIDGYQPELRAGVHWGRPRKVGGIYRGVNDTFAVRVCDADKAGQLLVSDPALALLPPDGLELGRRKRLKADGTPRELGTTPVSRATA